MEPSAGASESARDAMRIMDLKFGRIERLDYLVTVKVSLHNNSGRAFDYGVASCTAIDKQGDPLSTAPESFENVEVGTTVFGKAILTFDGRESDIRCRVESVSEG